MADELTARLFELETRFTLQQDVIDKLSEVMWRQQRELDALAARVASLEALRAVADQPGEPEPPEEPPPHY